MLASTVLLFSLLAADTAEGRDSLRADIRIEQIADAWCRRSEAFSEGAVEWEYDQNSLGRFESYWVPTNTESASRLQGAFRFSANAAQYRSRSTEYPVLGSRLSQTNEREYFRSALLSHFPSKDADKRKLLDYFITLTSDELVHSWQDRDSEQAEYPRAVVLPPSAISSPDSLARACGFASDSHDHLSGVPSSVLHQLSTLPCLLTFQPSLFDDRLTGMLDGVELTSDAGSFGNSLVSLTLPAGSSVEGALQWKLFCDPELDFSVRRILGSIGDKTIVQCDVSYDEHESGYWVPLEWTVQILGDDPSFVRQIVTAKRTRLDLIEKASREIEIAHAPATWVNDLVDNKQSLVLDDGSLWEIPSTHVGWLSYEQVLAKSRGEELDVVATAVPWLTQRRIVSALTQWPGLLLPLSIIGAGMFVAIRFFTPKKKAREQQDASATLPEQSSPAQVGVYEHGTD